MLYHCLRGREGKKARGTSKFFAKYGNVEREAMVHNGRYMDIFIGMEDSPV